jgi:hypothetical protein
MQTVFSHIIQKRYSQSYEDVATDALAYILNTHEPARMGMMEILREITPELPDLRFRTQLTEGSIRPDMWGYAGSDPYIFVENKFWAGLTDNQPLTYLDELAKYPHKTILMFIVPGAREQTMIAEVSRRLFEAEVNYKEVQCQAKEIIWLVKTSIGPSLALTSWPRIIENMKKESGDNTIAQNDLVLLESLCDAADIGKFIPMDSNYINDQMIPAIVMQLGQIIRDSINIGIRKQFLSNEGLTESVRWDRFGKYIWLNEPNSVGILFGLDYELWKEYGISPLWVKFSTTNFGRAYEVEPLLRESLDKKHLIDTLDDGSLVISINIKTKVDKDQVVEDIVEQLRELAFILKSLTINE